MRRFDVLLVLTFAAALVAGSVTATRRAARPPRVAAGWLVAADLHVHAFPGDGILAPRQLRGVAARNGLHVIALTNHNHKAQRRLTPTATGLPLVLTGEEVTMPEAHVVALGVERLVPWQNGVRAAADTIVARGGIAILAHPQPDVEASIGSDAMARMHGIEVANGPDFDVDRSTGAWLYSQRRAHATLAAIGSSDHHINAALGVQRTIMLVSELSEAGVLAAIRQGRTAVRFADAWVGDSAVVRAAQPHQAALFVADRRGAARVATLLACVLAWIALLGLVIRG